MPTERGGCIFSHDFVSRSSSTANSLTNPNENPQAGTGAFTEGFFRATAIAAGLATLCVILAQIVLTPMIGSTEGGLTALRRDPAFRAQEAVILVQVVLMFAALGGAALARWPHSTGLLVTGFAAFVAWQVLEIVPRSIDLFAASLEWAEQYAEATTEAERVKWQTVLLAWGDMWAAMGEVRRVFWGLGHLLFGLVFWRGAWMERTLAVLFLFNAVRLVPRMVGGWLEVPGLAGLLAGRWWFVLGMLPLFTVLGIWLWKEGRNRQQVTA